MDLSVSSNGFVNKPNKIVAQEVMRLQTEGGEFRMYFIPKQVKIDVPEVFDFVKELEK